MRRYKWHAVKLAPTKLALLELANVIIRDNSKPYKYGTYAFAHNQYWRLGGKCSAYCKTWYAAPHDDIKIKLNRDKDGIAYHFTNKAER